MICTRAKSNAFAAAKTEAAGDAESDPVAAEPSLAKRVFRFLAISAEWLGQPPASGVFDRNPNDAIGE